MIRHSLLWYQFQEKHPRKALAILLLLWPLTTIIGLILFPIVLLHTLYLYINQRLVMRKISKDLSKQGVSIDWDKVLRKS